MELSLSDRYVDVVDEGYDAVFRLGPLFDSALVSRRLESHRQIACASPAHLAARGIPIHPEGLAAHDCLDYVKWSGPPYAEWVFTKDGRSRTVTIFSRLQAPERTLHLLFAAGRPMTPKLRAFVDLVASELGSRSSDEPRPLGRSPAHN